MKLYILNKNHFIILGLLIFIFLFICFCLYNSKLTEASVKITSEKDLQSILDSDSKIAYLTFDDGPTTKMTNKILDILDEEDVVATFFVVGKHVKEHPEIVKRAYESGHYIGNHTYSHDNNIIYKSAENFLFEIISTDLAISEAIRNQRLFFYFF